jgi:hypothetical protein
MRFYWDDEQEEKGEAQNDVFWASYLHLMLLIMVLTYSESVGKCNHGPECCSISRNE